MIHWRSSLWCWTTCIWLLCLKHDTILPLSLQRLQKPVCSESRVPVSNRFQLATMNFGAVHETFVVPSSYSRILYWICLQPEKIFPLSLHLLGFFSFFKFCLEYFPQKGLCGYIIGGPSLEVTFLYITPFISFRVLIIVLKYFGYLFTYLSPLCLLLCRIKSVFSRPVSFLFNFYACCLVQCLACRGT